ncbi:glycosyltransferase [Corynebacterium epidermidicanis]|uniref:Glycosyltransferase n=1 Tax=Corynebacterium epidermidicanis TaxID=1050174 RepID=A0A0G3GQZ4_9CORY|nr:glycosyltransferase [Corynebacterium epidermidicanis]AKK01993.1 glycosyltransferase [Corynebacterium epidermidicanis]
MSILSIPANHPYPQAVMRMSPPALPEPEPWWPHPAFEPEWWEHHNPEIVHVHFGFEHLDRPQMHEFLKVLRARRIPLVVTVHDIDNPHLADQSAFHELLRLLLADAARILTLTTAARDRLVSEFQVPARSVDVVPHPAIVSPSYVPDPLPAPEYPAAVFLKSLRANTSTELQFYSEFAARQPLTVFVHADQCDHPLVQSLAKVPGITLISHAPMNDATLHHTIARCQVVLLPYIRGTHSGWLEMCRDLGAYVLAPNVGCYLSQADDPRAVREYPVGDGGRAGEIAAELVTLPRLVFQGDRVAQARDVEKLHAEMYHELRGPKFAIALVAPSRFPVREPYPGGLEAFCATARAAFRRHGHRVELYAVRGSDGHCREWEFPGVDWTGYEAQETDHTYPPGQREVEDVAFERLRGHLERAVAEGEIDVIHNNSLHPGLFLGDHPLPMVTTLHAPGFIEVQSGIDLAARRPGPHPAGIFTAVSQTTAASWQLPEAAHILPNSVDETLWRLGAGGEAAIWFGRIVPEKGLHIAIDACRMAGIPLRIAGRVGSPSYFEEELRPRLGPDLTWLGELAHAELAWEVARAKVCVVTPAWEEPFGLVVIEAMACGTPVAALARGGVAEILADFPDRLATDATGLARALERAASADRQATAQWAVDSFSLRRFADRYTELFAQVIA